ncbi:MAG: HypC/HybG/HupF family hydrogenase formation chaperone [Candidatus Bathyarchaeota archaeon]|nr:HypC/HybG/HupF family hydrogenase formation chaperone [Candidatus Bathyarchaeota archaeon]MCX8176910.1 HypC/HybG/HupF family hydrogenase formation chaperone [Candidatus Bathyarchaeota archaeon]MDW8193403.1 HypC/HybG/HupF family hydrogenase formation chaperone [Nitrososphaerota archaeon]
MCLAIPARVIDLDISKGVAKVDFGEGVLREVDVSLVDVKVGEYVLIHAGYAIQTLSPEEAEETLRIWSEILQAEKELKQK